MIAAAPIWPRDDAAALIARVASSAASGVARRALVLRLSCLPPALARPHHMRLARAALDPLRAADRAESFELANADTAVLWRGAGGSALQASLDAVAELFAGAGDPAPDPAALCLLLDLPQQAETLLRVARDSRGHPALAPTPTVRPPLDPAGLAALEAALARADVARFVRRRPVCALAPDGTMTLAWDKRVLCVSELEAELAPGRAIRAEPWLFRRLTRTLDQRMLALLAAAGELQGAGPLALDLNVTSILAPAFLRFDAVLPAALRGLVVLDLRPPDILSDLPAFLFARDFAQARNYRLLLHDVAADLPGLLALSRLGLDLVQVRWSPALAATDPRTLNAGTARLVLGGADTPAALEWGRRRGITLFQGRAVAPSAATAAAARRPGQPPAPVLPLTRWPLISAPAMRDISSDTGAPTAEMAATTRNPTEKSPSAGR